MYSQSSLTFVTVGSDRRRCFRLFEVPISALWRLRPIPKQMLSSKACSFTSSIAFLRPLFEFKWQDCRESSNAYPTFFDNVRLYEFRQFLHASWESNWSWHLSLQPHQPISAPFQFFLWSTCGGPLKRVTAFIQGRFSHYTCQYHSCLLQPYWGHLQPWYVL